MPAAVSRSSVLSFIARFRAGFAPTSVLAEDGRVGYSLPSSGVGLEGCQHGARKVELLGELEWVVDVGRYINKICRGSLASSFLEALVSVARPMEIVASAA